jgi:hypothetical protein
MRESGPFIDLTGGKRSSSGAGPSEVKEEPEDEVTRLAREYAWFIRGDAPQMYFLVKFHPKFVIYE